MSLFFTIKSAIKLSIPFGTVRNGLKSAKSFNYAKFKAKPKLQKHHKYARLKIASFNVLNCNIRQKLIFTDEKKINIEGPDGSGYYSRDLRSETYLLSRRAQGGNIDMI